MTRSAKSLFQWSAVLRVTKGPFRGQSFELSLQMAFDYPESGPLVKLVSPPLACAHPRVDSVSGEVIYGEWMHSEDGGESKSNNDSTILGVLRTVHTLLVS